MSHHLKICVFSLTNSLLSLLIAYQQKSYSLALASTSSKEVVTTTYIGLVFKGNL